MSNPYEQYKRNSVVTAGPGELTVMLFEGCCKFLKNAETAINEKNIIEAHNNLTRAEDIVMELMNSLNFEYPISQNLYSHYDYIYHEIVQVNIKKDAEKLKPIIRTMQEYADTWGEAVKIDRNSKRKLCDQSYV